MSTVGSIGVGLFVLIIFWIVALVAFVISVKLESNFGWIVLALVVTLTVTLLVIPLENKDQTDDFITEEKDLSAVGKNLLLSFLLLSAFLAFVYFFVSHCIEPIRIKPVSTFK